jgi:hypothetical protein
MYFMGGTGGVEGAAVNAGNRDALLNSDSPGEMIDLLGRTC